MHIKLFNFQGECIKEAKISATALVAPSTLSFQGMFFKLKMQVGTSSEKFLAYRQCRGAFLSDIEIVQGVQADV